MIFNMSGGGSGGLSLDIIASTTRPENPVNNTIWINTDQELGQVYFQATAPTEVTTGDVWVNTAVNYSSADQSVIVDNFTIPIMSNPYLTICVNTVMQYNGSEWIRPDVEVFIGGEWKPKVLYLFDYGTYSSLGNFGLAYYYRGGESLTYYPSGYLSENYKIVFNPSGYIYVHATSNYSKVFALVSPKVDISEFNTIDIIGYNYNSVYQNFYVWIVKAKEGTLKYFTDSDTDRWYRKFISDVRAIECTIDVSSYSGEVFILFNNEPPKPGDSAMDDPTNNSAFGVRLDYMALY